MYIRSVPADSAGTVVLAVRGTASFADWAVNLRAEPVEPTGFLEDSGNACHAGFLSVARAMVRPAASSLRRILRDDPSRAAHSLVLTGHSAGGAVAALLYLHMLAHDPPPLTNPPRRDSIFLALINEGDPVARADKAYIRSLLALLASPPPTRSPGPMSPTFWPVPPSTLSNAGHIVVLRGSARSPHQDEVVEAVSCRDDQLRTVIWGDPLCHLMSLYASRVETLAAQAIAVEIP
ncbi:lipase, class 3 [Ophiocordyceps camponoti-floridani]|uniref:Lipase, class 3 n=1 Tax=Ophiocordyceps camponoti-floridani TaxID=2030778 RepID=A0A8H4Q7G1_9HYPO|nr:lipase, class 3 [Ophiocordyceps camponoti-floridani]